MAATVLVKKAGVWVALVGASPPPSGHPDATNTGVPAGTVLTAANGSTITTANTVLDSLDISGVVNISAANVTIRRCRIDAGGGPVCVNVNSGNVTLTDCELLNFNGAALRYSDYVGIRLNIHTFGQDGMKLGDNVTLQDSWVHDSQPQSGAHADGMQAESGASNLIIQRNNIDCSTPGSNSAIFLKNDLGGSDSAGPVLIDSNLISGGNYTFYAVPGGSGHLMDGITVTNNKFVRGTAQYGPVDVDMTIDSWTGNVYSDNGEAITL